MMKEHYSQSVKYKQPVFSLIELLVVVAIISILMSILLPALVKVRERGNELQCKSQLKNIGHAIQFYVNDWNGYNVPAQVTYDNDWSMKLAEYLSEPNVVAWNQRVDTSLFRCPKTRLYPGKKWVYNSYAITTGATESAFTTFWKADGSHFKTPPKISTWHDPSDLILVVDGLLNPQNRASNELTTTNLADGTVSKIDPRHITGANYMYADLHVNGLKGNNQRFSGDWHHKPTDGSYRVIKSCLPY